MIHNNDNHEKTCPKDCFCPFVEHVDDYDDASCTIPCWNSCRNCSTMLKQQQAVERTMGVIETSQEALCAIWRQLADRNQWMLVDDEDAFIKHVAAEYQSVSNAKTTRERQETAIKRAYGVYLYNGVQKRQNRAFYELGLLFVRLAVKDKIPLREAEELAQVTVQAILEKIGSVKFPPSFLWWSYTVFRTERQRQRTSSDKEIPFPTNAQGETIYEAVDPHKPTVDTEQKIAAHQVLLLLRAAVRNDRELQVIWKIIVDEDRTREVAQDLGVSEQTVRTIKHRALERLKKNEELRAHLHKLDHDPHTDSGVIHEEQ